MNEINKDDWYAHSKLVLHELERLNRCYENIKRDISEIKQEVAVLKVKSGIWGAVGGAVPVLVILIMKLMGSL